MNIIPHLWLVDLPLKSAVSWNAKFKCEELIKRASCCHFVSCCATRWPGGAGLQPGRPVTFVHQSSSAPWPLLRAYGSCAPSWCFFTSQPTMCLCDLKSQTLGRALGHRNVILHLNDEQMLYELWHHRDELCSATKRGEITVLQHKVSEHALMLRFIFPACIYALLPPHQGCQKASVQVQERLIASLASELA